MNNLLVRLIGLKALAIHGDPTTFDRWRWAKRHLKSGPLRTLDAGCGSGLFIFFAETLGNESIGISFDARETDKALARARLLNLTNTRFLTIDLRNLEDYANQLGLFDQILCFETLEHLKDDQQLLRVLTRLLKRGGRLLVTTPYKHYRHLLGDTISEVEDGGHVRWGYTHEEMKSLFEGCGLEIIVQEYISGFASQQLTNFYRLLTRVNGKMAWLVSFPFRILQFLDSPLSWWMNYPPLSIGVVGRLPGLKNAD